jgi:hypothetical protein
MKRRGRKNEDISIHGENSSIDRKRTGSKDRDA